MLDEDLADLGRGPTRARMQPPRAAWRSGSEREGAVGRRALRLSYGGMQALVLVAT